MARTEFIKKKLHPSPKKNYQAELLLQAGVAPFKAEAISVRGLGLQYRAEGFYVVLSEARTTYRSKRKLLWFRLNRLPSPSGTACASKMLTFKVSYIILQISVRKESAQPYHTRVCYRASREFWVDII
jgi:hypothetical protein